MNIERSFVFAFKAPQAAQKLAVGTLFTLLFFTVFFAFVTVGYLVRILCNALDGRDANLPDWKDLPGLFQEGLTPGLVVLSYFGPLVVLVLLEFLFYAAFGESPGVSTFFSLLRFLCYLFITAVVPLAIIRLVVIGSFKASFQLREIIGFIKANPAQYLPAWGASLGIVLVAQVVGLLSYGLGSVVLTIVYSFLSFLAYVITVHLFAGAYRASNPFSDDHQGEIRASMSVPPPLRQVKK